MVDQNWFMPSNNGMQGGPWDRTPMFAAPPPQYTGPFNMGGNMGLMMQLASPMLLANMSGGAQGTGNFSNSGGGMFPAQFFPQSNIFSQLEAQRDFMARQSAMNIAAQQDTGAMHQTLGGLQQLITGKPLTDHQQARNFRLAQGISGAMPLLTQILGPDMIDRLHGSRGSATVFAQQFHQAMRTGIDPITGQVGMSGESTGMMTQDVFEQLFGENANFAAMRGMSAGQAGIAVNELQVRGMMGRPIGTLPLQSQRSLLSRALPPDVLNRLATQLPEIQDTISAGGTPTEKMLANARQQVKESHRVLTDPQTELTSQDIENMPGADGIIRAADADRISGRLKNMAGAIKAMRDIFGDMGNPNAPMRQIINGLDMMTQGGLATMPMAQVEQMVRRTQVLAKQTGVGVEGIMALSSQNAPLADQLGLDRSFAVRAAHESVAFGAAAGNVLALGTPAWGAQTKEQLTLNDTQLRMHAAASPLANQFAAITRMADTGMVAPEDGTELAQVIKAARAGDLEYEFGGKKRSMVIHRTQLNRILLRDGGLTSGESNATISDVFGNQEYVQRYNHDNTARRQQAADTRVQMLDPLLGSRFSSILGEEEVDALMQAQGIVTDTPDFNRAMDQVGRGISKAYMGMDAETVRDAAKRREVMGAAFKDQLRLITKQRKPNATPAEIDKMVDAQVNQMGGPSALPSMGETIHATINRAAREHPNMGSAVGMHGLMSEEAMDEARKQMRQADATGLIQSALAGIGTAGPLRRVADLLQGADSTTSPEDILKKVMGVVNLEELESRDPTGKVAEMLGLVREARSLDPNKPEDFKKIQENAGLIKGLNDGGAAAEEQLKLIDASRKKITAAEATEEQRTDALNRLEEKETKARNMRDARHTNNSQLLKSISEKLGISADETIDATVRDAAKTQAINLTKTMLPRDGVDLRDGRWLTKQGIETRDGAGQVIDTQTFSKDEDGTVMQTAQEEIRKRHAETARKNAEIAAKLAFRSVAERENAATFLGAPTRGNTALRKAMEAAVDGGITKDMTDVGFMLKASINPEQIAATSNKGAVAQKYLDDGIDNEASGKAIRTFVLGSRERARQLMRDSHNMEQLGRGSVNLVQGAMDASGELQAMAEEHNVSVEDLLQEKGVPTAAAAKAKKIMSGMQDSWTEIRKRSKSHMLPGTGDGENALRLPMTDREKQLLGRHQNFINTSTTEEEQANITADRLAQLGTVAQRSRLGTDTGQQELSDALKDGNRSRRVSRALDNRDALLEMGIEKGLFKDKDGNEKKNKSDLTVEETSSVIKRLRALSNLTPKEKADIDSMTEAAGPFMGVGTNGKGADGVTQDLLKRIDTYNKITPAAATDKKDKDLNVKITGTVTPRLDGLWDVEMSGNPLDDVANYT